MSIRWLEKEAANNETLHEVEQQAVMWLSRDADVVSLYSDVIHSIVLWLHVKSAQTFLPKREVRLIHETKPPLDGLASFRDGPAYLDNHFLELFKYVQATIVRSLIILIKQ